MLDEMVTGTPEEIIRPQLIELGIKQSLATRYTSFVAIEQTPVRPPDVPSNEHAVPNLMPAGNQMHLPFPATATSAKLSFYLGILCIVFSLLIFLYLRRMCLQPGKV